MLFRSLIPFYTPSPASIPLGNVQNLRIFRRIPNETYVTLQNFPSYLDPGFLVPFNFDPRYNVYDLARRAGIIT